MAAPLQAEDTSKTKVFVGGLSWETTTDGLRQWADQFGPLKEAVVIMDRNTGRSKGYGFVTFGTVEAAAKCCENPTPTIEGRRANCNLAAIGAKQRTGPPGPGYGRGRGFQGGFPGGAAGYQNFQQYGAPAGFPSAGYGPGFPGYQGGFPGPGGQFPGAYAGFQGQPGPAYAQPFPGAQAAFPGQQGPAGAGFPPGAQANFQGGAQGNSFPQGQYAQHGGFQGGAAFNGGGGAGGQAGQAGTYAQAGQSFPAGGPQQQQFYAPPGPR